MRFLPLAIAALLATPAGAQELKLAIAAPATSMDPHFYNAATATPFINSMFNSLVWKNKNDESNPSSDGSTP